LNKVRVRGLADPYTRTGPGGNLGEHCGLDRGEASRAYVRSLDDRFQPGVPPTDDFGGPSGKGVPFATAELSTAVPVGPPRPSSITHPEAAATGLLQRL
jgi:hypothetical protein